MKQIGNVSFWKTVGIVWEHYKPFKKALIVSVTMASIVSAIQMVFPYLYGRMSDQIYAASGESGFHIVLVWSIIFFIVIAVDALLNYARECYEIRHLDIVVSGYHDVSSLRKLMRWTLGQLQGDNSGKIRQIINKGQSSLQGFMSELLYNIIPLSVVSVYAIIGLFFLDYRLGLLVFVCSATYLSVVIFKTKEITKELARIEKLDIEEGVIQSEIMRNLDLVKIHNKEEFGVKEVQEYHDRSNSRNIKFWIRYLNFSWSSQSIIAITEVLTLAFGGYLVFGLGAMTPGLLITVFLWTRNVVSQVSRVGHVQRRIMREMAKIHQFHELLQQKPLFESDAGILAPHIQGNIEIQNLSFAYPKRKKKFDIDELELDEEEEGTHKALENISIIFEAGKRYAIVGHSGSGKSTLRQLLLRAYDPQEGSISYDGINLKEYNLNSLHQHIAVVEQEVAVFDRPLKENITWVLPDPHVVSKEDLDKVIEMSAIDQFLPKLDHGLDTMLGEKGVKLSGGERQRVGIARALMKNPKVLILDEATSHLDAVNEDDITQALERASVGRTTIVIAHRLSTIVSADEIIVMDQGKVVGTGTHNHLFKTCPAYKDLVDAQLKAIHKLKI